MEVEKKAHGLPARTANRHARRSPTSWRTSKETESAAAKRAKEENATRAARAQISGGGTSSGTGVRKNANKETGKAAAGAGKNGAKSGTKGTNKGRKH
eukprot:g11255.t1